MSSARESELELKVELTRDQLQRVRWHPALGDLAAAEPVTRNLRSIYFDTPDHRLRALDISLRVRSDGERWLQTVKAGTAVRNGVSNPLEMEVAVERPEPDLELIDNRKVRRKVEKAIARSILEPVFETVVERTTRHLHSADGELELALDEGTVRAGGAEDAVCEAELELKSGRAGMPAAHRRQIVRGGARAPFREQQGRARLQPGARQDQRARPRRAATRRVATNSSRTIPAPRRSPSSCNRRATRSPPTGAPCWRRWIPPPRISCASACAGCAARSAPFVPCTTRSPCASWKATRRRWRAPSASCATPTC